MSIKIKGKEIIYNRKESKYLIDFHGLVFHITKWVDLDYDTEEFDSDYTIVEKKQYDELTDEKKDELDDFITSIKL